MDFITVTLHFEVKNAELYGGAGSVGYAAMGMGFDSIEKVAKLDQTFIDGGIQGFAETCNVPVGDVKLITKAEYDRETEGDDDDDDFIGAEYDC